jgi:hypothetical protein
MINLLQESTGEYNNNSGGGYYQKKWNNNNNWKPKYQQK